MTEFGVNLNNREPLITSDYTLADLLDLAELAEQRGFGSVWVGDSLFSKPRFEPISLLSAISQRTTRAKLGTACLVTSTRNPLYLALEWATLDQLSGGRTILGACMGNPEHGVRREFEALGLPFGQRAAVFEECLAVLRSLWTTGKVTHHGEYYDFDDVSFYSGTEMGPLMPVQQPPPTWVISNIRLTGELAPEVATKRMHDACARVIRYGDGWMNLLLGYAPEGGRRADHRAAQGGRRPRRGLRPVHGLLPGHDEHRRLGRPGLQRVRRIHHQLLPRAQQVRGPVQLGPHRYPGNRGGLVPAVQRGRGESLYLPLRRPRPVRPAGALRRRSASRSQPGGPRAERSVILMTEEPRTEAQMRAAAELVVDTCFEVKEGDVVTIITDDRRKPEEEMVATVVAERGGLPIVANNEAQIRRALADTLFPMVPPRNLHQAMVTSDQIIIMTNLEWANRFAHVPAVKESVANMARIGSIEEGFGRWPISVADIEQTIGEREEGHRPARRHETGAGHLARGDGRGGQHRAAARARGSAGEAAGRDDGAGPAVGRGSLPRRGGPDQRHHRDRRQHARHRHPPARGAPDHLARRGRQVPGYRGRRRGAPAARRDQRRARHRDHGRVRVRDQ